MANIQHPSKLNAWQKYRQACSFFKNTSRSSNPAWYQDALELKKQLHIRVDGPSAFSAYYDAGDSSWSPGPQVSEELLTDEQQYGDLIHTILEQAKSERLKSIGIVVHIADEFATTELKPDFDNPNALAELRITAIENPAQILEDASIDTKENSWRVLPYSAAGSDTIGTAITISNNLAPFLRDLRKAGENANFPIITQSISAPLVALMGLPSMLKGQPEKPFVTVFQYPWFTAIAFFNEHADLRLVRTLHHRGLRQVRNFSHALFTTCASLEFMEPDLFFVPLGEEIDHALADSIRMQFANSRIETLVPPKSDDLPPWAPEPLITVSSNSESHAVSSESLISLREEKWALQDFLPNPKEILEIFPSRAEMNLLKVTRLARMVIAILALGGLGYFGLGVMSFIKQPEWSFQSGQASVAKIKLAHLNQERNRIDYWNNLLEDRSKAWVVMESVARMFPADSAVLLKGINYSAKPDSSPGQARSGFVKSWRITGYARDAAINHLNQLNTRDGINNVFEEIAEVTGSSAYLIKVGNRNVSVNIRTRENNTFRPTPLDEAIMKDESTYPFTFELTITQRFEGTDPLAIIVSAAP